MFKGTNMYDGKISLSLSLSLSELKNEFVIRKHNMKSVKYGVQSVLFMEQKFVILIKLKEN